MDLLTNICGLSSQDNIQICTQLIVTDQVLYIIMTSR